MQMDNVSLPELSCACYADAHVGDVRLPELRAPEAAAGQDDKPFDDFWQLASYLDDARVGRLLVAHHHLSIHAVLAEGIQETTCCYAASAAFACADQQDFHRYTSFPSHLLMRLRMDLKMYLKLP